MTVLIVENEPAVRNLVCAQLRDQGVHVTMANSLTDATQATDRHVLTVVIVDLSLPDDGGFTFLGTIAESQPRPHVIVMSTSTAESDRNRAFEHGANDFVVKPFFARELAARVLAVRRHREATDSLLQVGALEVDLLAREVVADGRTLDLTAKEFDLLAYLAARPGYVFSRDQLLEAVWNSSSEWQQAATVTEHIRRLRSKIEADPHRPVVVRTVRGAGYRLDLPGAGRRATVPAGPIPEPGVVIHVDGTPVFADRAAGAMVGAEDATDLVGRHLFELMAQGSKAAAAGRMEAWTAGEVRRSELVDLEHADGTAIRASWPAWESLELKGRWCGEGSQATRDGSVVGVLAATTLLRDELGAPVCIVSVNRLSDAAGRAAARAPATSDEAEIRLGLTNGAFEVYFQPVVDLNGGTVVAVEALVRWAHPERGLLAPGAFLDAAESSGLIVELGHFVLEQACDQVARWRREGWDIQLSVNLSIRQVADPGMVERLVAVLDSSGLDPAALWLEVTETAVVKELEVAAKVLHRLVALGIRVAIDDFGTGWASLTYLQCFPVHAVKIDGSFVAGAGRNLTDTAIVRSIVSLGNELDLLVVAEGIETTSQQEAMRQLGCLLGQGYLYGRPTPASEVPTDRANRLDDPPGPARAGMGPTPLSTDGARTAVRSVELRPNRGVSTLTRMAPVGDRVEFDAIANMLRGLLRVRSTGAAVELLQRTIRHMGGTLVDAVAAGEHALPIDVSLGEGPPTVVEVERFTVARMQLEQSLPRLVEDARQAVDLLRQTERLEEETVRDGLTGLSNRRVLDRVIARSVSGTVVMIDLDHFKAVNDEAGHAAGDAVLVAFGHTLESQVRAVDAVCRVGGEEFAIISADIDAAGAVELTERIRTAWAAAAPEAVTFSAGVATVSDGGGTSALLAADRALYRAKALGRDRTEVAAHDTEAVAIGKR